MIILNGKFSIQTYVQDGQEMLSGIRAQFSKEEDAPKRIANQTLERLEKEGAFGSINYKKQGPVI